MAYHVYHTDAIILGGRPSGEGDRLLIFYTRDLGLVYARAKSIREHRSRLRYVLQTFAHVDLDLIRGKHGWKLISARPINSHASLWADPLKRVIVAEQVHLLRRLIQGEETHPALFSDVLLGFQFLSTLEAEHDVRAVELVFVVRMLSRLGYFSFQEEDLSLLHELEWNMGMLEVARTRRQSLLADVNHALSASQL